MHRVIRFFTTVVYVLLAACSSTYLVPQSQSHSHSPELVSILNGESGQPIDFNSFISKIKDADIIYLAEQHDNPEHHFWQKEIIKQLATQHSIAIGFEMFPYTESSRLLALPHDKALLNIENKKRIEEIIRAKINWKGERDQQNWEWYGQIINQGVNLQQTMFGIDLPISLRSRITKAGVSTLTSVEKSLLMPTGFENSRYQELMFDKFRKSHCGWGDKDYLSNLYDNWIARNDVMANTISKMAVEQEGPVVVIVGSGHTEYNMGVFERVSKISPDLVQVNIGLIGLNREQLALPSPELTNLLKPDVSDYTQRYQWLWLTNRPADREDPCKAFMEHKKKNPSKI